MRDWLERITILIAALLMACAGAALAEDAVRVMPEAVVHGADVRLIDLVEPADRALVTGVDAGIVLAGAPSTGRTLRLVGATLEDKIEREGATRNYHVPESVEIRRATKTIKASAIRARIEEQIARRIPWPHLKRRVEYTSGLKDVEVPQGSVGYRVNPARGADMVGRTSFLVEIAVDGQLERRLWVGTEIHVYARAFKAAKNLRKYHNLGELDLVPTEIDLADGHSGAVLDKGAVMGLRTSHPVSAGTVLTRRMVELPPLVKRGDVVTIILVAGGMTIKAVGEVREDGQEDDRVRVENLQTGRTIYARVLDPNTVTVDF